MRVKNNIFIFYTNPLFKYWAVSICLLASLSFAAVDLMTSPNTTSTFQRNEGQRGGNYFFNRSQCFL